MPRQEHLPQAGRALPRGRGVQRAHAGAAALSAPTLPRPRAPNAPPRAIAFAAPPSAPPPTSLAALLAVLLACALLAILPGTAFGTPVEPAFRGFDAIEAARTGWDADTAPVDGWTAVTLPDGWSRRWDGFDGVVWYRLRWHEDPDPGALRPLGLVIDYVNMAGAVYLNGSLIARDDRLVEPLSRSWNLPRRWLLDAPLLRPGANELLVRVSGIAGFEPGLGAVRLGIPAAVDATYHEATLVRRSLQLLGIGLTLVMGVLYGMLWLLRRSELSYGWFSLFSLLWLPYSYNFIATSAWPFASTDAFQRANHAALLASIVCFFMFVLHFCEVGRPRRRHGVLLAGAAGVALIVLSPPALRDTVRGATVLIALGLYLWGCGVIARHAWVSRRLEATVLALSMLLPVAAGVHDTLVFFERIAGNRYYVSLSSSTMLLGISFALTWRMVKGMRLVEHFNVELQQRVGEARRRLAEGLHRQHAAELVQTRLSERLSLVRDLHDGLGMTLSSHIHTLGSRRDADSDADVALWALREVNDDLRLIIESSSFDDTDELAERLVPLRHRCTRVLEAADIDCHWTLEGLQGCRLGGRRSLDFLRVLQEALANVLKHSGATRVDVRIAARDGRLTLAVRDNGRGFVPAAADRHPADGMGLSSMRARAARLGGTLDIGPGAGAAGITLVLHCPADAGISA